MDKLAKKLRDRSNSARPSSPAAQKAKHKGKDDQAGGLTDEPRRSPDFRPQRKNLPMLILSIVLLTAWLIAMLVIAVNK